MSATTTKPAKVRNNNALTMRQLYATKHKYMHFTGKWLATFGNPQWGGSIGYSGGSGDGKSHLSAQLCEYLANNFGAVLYNAGEEPGTGSIKERFMEYDMHSTRYPVTLLKGETLQDLTLRLRKRKAPKIVFIDSVHYFLVSDADQRPITVIQYKKLVKEFDDTLFIWVAHEEKGEPEGRTAKKIIFDSQVKGRVEGFKLFVKSARTKGGTGQPFTIWEQGAADYWDMITDKTNTKK